MVQALSLFGLVLQPILVLALIAKGLIRRFAVFGAYCVFNCVATFALYSLRNHSVTYFWGYWASEAISVLLGFGVLYEVFKTLFDKQLALSRLAARLFTWTLCALLTLGFFVLYRHAFQHGTGVVVAIMTVEEVTRILEVGLLFFIFVFAAAFGLHWRQHVFGIALGLGIFTAVELAAISMRLQYGFSLTSELNIVRAVAFDTSLLIWIGYVLAPERVTNVELPKTAQLEQWNQAIMELIHQ